MLQAVLFDLDGTLADTALDLSDALNRLLQAEGLAPISIDVVRPMISHGVSGMLKLSMHIEETDYNFSRLRKDYLDLYEHVFTNQTVLFTGINSLIEIIVNLGLQWGIITNKSKIFTNRLVEKLDFVHTPDVIVSGDTTSEAKPSTKPIFFACHELGVKANHCIYVGDAKRDIEAGNRAGMITVLAHWGYLSEEDKQQNWGADFKIDTPSELLSIIQKFHH